jgi:hypothetical protein
MKTKTFTIYGLIDPTSPDEFRYIGATSKDPDERANGHFADAEENTKNPKNKNACARWVMSLKRNNIKVQAIALETNVPEDKLPERESYWIAYYRNSEVVGGQGHRLTNTRSGGSGNTTQGTKLVKEPGQYAKQQVTKRQRMAELKANDQNLMAFLQKAQTN